MFINYDDLLIKVRFRLSVLLTRMLSYHNNTKMVGLSAVQTKWQTITTENKARW